MLKVWGRKNSSNVQKVMWCIGELGLGHDRIDIGGPFGGNQEAAYLAKNPNGLVPTLEDGDLVLWESNTIVRYLSARYGLGKLCPDNLGERARAERWMDWQLSTLAPDMTPLFLGLVRTPPEKRDGAVIERSRKSLASIWARLDRSLEGNRYVGGDRFTMGDIPCGIMAYRWFTLPIERPELKHLRTWYDRLTERPAFREHVMMPLS